MGARYGRHLGVLLAGAGALFLAAASAPAYFTAGGAGTASASVGALDEPTVTATSPEPGQARIAWTAVPVPTGADEEVTFVVERAPSSGSTWVLVCGTGTAPKPFDERSCVDTPAGDAEYRYRVTARFRTWTSSGEDTVFVAGPSLPSVVAMVADGPSPTNATSVSWTITFSEPVTGVDASDFALAGAGAVGAALVGVSGGGAVYAVAASTGADGLLRLDLVDDDSIADLAGNPLAGPGGGNGDFEGDAYLVDRTAPTVSSIARAGASPTNAGPLVWTVTFSESVSGVHPSDFALVASGISGTPTIISVAPSGPVPTATWTVSASVAGVTGTNSGSIRLDLATVGVITDAAANPLAGTFVGEAYTFDTTAPSLASLVMLDVDRDGRVDRVEATFDEPLGSYGAGTSGWTLASVPSGGTLSSVSVSGAVATLAIAEGAGAPSTAVGSFTVAYAPTPSGIRDALGNASAAFGPTAPADGAAPVAVDVQAVNGTGTAGRIDAGDLITLTFSEPMLSGSILAGWSGAVTPVTVELGDGASTDTVSVSTPGVSLGAIDTGGNYVRSTRTVSATMALSGASVTLRLTSTAPPGQLHTVSSSTLTWTPSSAATDPAGNAMVTTPRTQAGAPRRNF
jgi:hypothetical protein